MSRTRCPSGDEARFKPPAAVLLRLVRVTHRAAALLLLDERQHAGEDASAHDQVPLLLHVKLEDPQHHWQQDAA